MYRATGAACRMPPEPKIVHVSPVCSTYGSIGKGAVMADGARCHMSRIPSSVSSSREYVGRRNRSRIEVTLAMVKCGEISR